MANFPASPTNHPNTAGLVRHPSTTDTNHPGSTANNHPSGFNGNFAQLFASFVGAGNVLQVAQTDLGPTIGGTPLPGGTAPVTVTLTGSLTGSLVPLLFRVQTAGVIGAGATFNLSVDGGATNIMTNFAPAVATPFALTGAASGLSAAWAAGSSLADNTWTGTHAAQADQTANGKNWIQVTPSAQPLITVGLNGKAGLSYDGVQQEMTSSVDFPAPPFWRWGVFRVTGVTAAAMLHVTDSGRAGGVLYSPTGGVASIASFNTTNVNSNAASTVGTWGRFQQTFTNSVADQLKFGATPITGANAGPTNPAAAQVWGSGGGGLFFSKSEWLVLVQGSGAAPTQAQWDIASAAVTAYYGASVAV